MYLKVIIKKLNLGKLEDELKEKKLSPYDVLGRLTSYGDLYDDYTDFYETETVYRDMFNIKSLSKEQATTVVNKIVLDRLNLISHEDMHYKDLQAIIPGDIITLDTEIGDYVTFFVTKYGYESKIESEEMLPF